MVHASAAKTPQDKALLKKQYIFAIDRTQRATQKRLIEAISKGIGTGQVDDRGENAYNHYPIEQKEFLTMNLKMRASDAFKDGDVPEDAGEDAEELAKKLKFPWHCEKGIGENIRMLNEEFNKNRGLNPVKIFITGPPASGKTFYSERLAVYYNIPRVHAKELAERAFSLAKFEEGQGTELGEEIKAKIEEIKDAMVAQIEEARQALGDDAGEQEEIDREKLQVRLPDDLLFKVLRVRLSENDCRNRGYVLDGFPKTYKQAQEVFLYKPKKLDENGEEIAEEEPELEEGEEKSWDGYVVRPEIFPKSVILLDAHDDHSLLVRIKDTLPETYAAGSHYNEADMTRRLAAYRKANNSLVAEPALKQFFEQQGV
jgi:adenylate kinase